MSHTLGMRIKRDEEQVKVTVEGLFCRAGNLVIWTLVLIGIGLSILLLHP